MEIPSEQADTFSLFLETIHFVKSLFGITAEVLRTDTDFPQK